MKRISTLTFVFLVGGLLGAVPSAAQQQEEARTITGTVTSAEDGRTLPGTSVLAVGTESGTATAADGSYMLEVPAAADSLRFSFVGFGAKTVAIAGRSEIDVALSPNTKAMEEVVVVGFGEQRQRELTGSISQVTAEEIQDVPVSSFQQAMQGKAAGVRISKNNGKLGQGIQVRVRGSASVSADNQPLYIVDGVPVTTTNLSGNGAATNPLAQLNTSDIQSVQVLKDASAAAIYGARASNGVVIIETKDGFEGGTQITADVQRTWSTPTNRVDMLNAEEYVDYYTEAARNGAAYRYENNIGNYRDDFASKQAAIDAELGYVRGVFDFLSQGIDWRDLDVQSDWQEQAFRDDAGGTKVDLSARGGGDNTTFYLSGSYNEQRGILVRDNYDLISGNVKVDHDLSDRFNVGGKLSLSRSLNTRLPNDNQFSTPIQLIAQPAISPIYAPQTEGVEMEEGYLSEYQPSEDFNQNTLYLNNLIYGDNASYETTSFRSIGNAYVEADVLPKLTFRSQFGLDLLDQNEDLYYNSTIEPSTNGYGYNSWDRVINYNSSSYFTYTEDVLGDENLEATAGVDFQGVDRNGSFVEGEQFPNDDFQQVASAGEIVGGESYETAYRFLAFFGRASYSFDDKYLLKVSGRYEGSSRFGENNRYGFFPAASAGWIMTEEPFLSDSDVVNFLKLRASYGLTGNAGIGNFDARGLWGATSYGGRSGILPSQIPNPDLKWERSAQLDVGLDFGFFDDRINGEMDYYIRNTDNLLLDVNVPATTGFLTQTRNVGALTNHGFELLLNTDNLRGDFTWSTSLNLSINRNEITDLNGQVIEGGAINRAIEGEPIGVFYGREYAGVDPQNGDALYYVNEKNDEGDVIDGETTTNDPNAANRVVLGQPQPDFSGGLGNQFSYAGFGLNVFFNYSYGGKIYDAGGNFKTSNARFFDNQHVSQLDAWQEPGDQTDVPEARLGLSNGDVESSRYLYDGSYVRLKNVTLAYTLPQSLTGRIGASKARLYVTGVNLLTFTDYRWWDPEVNADYLAEDSNLSLGNEFYSAPQARKISTGVRLTF